MDVDRYIEGLSNLAGAVGRTRIDQNDFIQQWHVQDQGFLDGLDHVAHRLFFVQGRHRQADRKMLLFL